VNGYHQSAGLAQSFDLPDLRDQFPFFLQEWLEQEDVAGFQCLYFVQDPGRVTIGKIQDLGHISP